MSHEPLAQGALNAAGHAVGRYLPTPDQASPHNRKGQQAGKQRHDRAQRVSVQEHSTDEAAQEARLADDGDAGERAESDRQGQGQACRTCLSQKTRPEPHLHLPT